MLRLILLLSISLFFKPTLSLGQNGTDKAKAIELFKKTTPLFEQLLNFNVTNKDSALIINKRIIENLKEIYATDTSNPFVGHYLAYCYRIEGNHREVVKWSVNQLLHSKYLPDISYYNYYIGSSYISLGELDSSKTYIKKAISICENDSLMESGQIRNIILGIKDIADSVYTMTDANLTNQLRLKGISSCKYALQIVNYIKPFAEKYLDNFFLSKTQKEMRVIEENCR